MNATRLLDQLLKSGQDLINRQQPAGEGGARGLDAFGTRLTRDQSGVATGGGLLDSLGGLLKREPASSGGSGLDAVSGLFEDKDGKSQLGSFLAGAGGGALAGTALSLLLGNKSARKIGGQVITYGGLAALGVLAYQAYDKWQNEKGAGTSPSAPQPLNPLPPAQEEHHSRAILKAMITAAKADGHVDERERQLLTEAFDKLGGQDPELSQWLTQELNQPLDPAAVARAATTPKLGAEIYIASLLVVDEEHFLERAYLDELARQLGLDPGLKAELEQQVKLESAQI